ncbi:ornithine decarboxylase-like [Clinocottus analis]|uniref:ornithine decarboxylase-like n=1 Tax=Clinocottus analis TaxID=304258 RepID=UPI0035BFB9AC
MVEHHISTTGPPVHAWAWRLDPEKLTIAKTEFESMECLAPATIKGSVVQVLSSENCDVDILDNGRTIRDFIDNKIKELGSADNDEPFYVASLDGIFEKHLRWRTNLPRVKPFYAVKCNNDAAVLRMMSALDTGFDCASKVEIQLMLSLGVTPDKIIYGHTTKPLSHIKYACTHGVHTMTFDSEDELLKISRCHAKAKLVLRIAVDDSASKIRLSSKFGASLESAAKLLGRAGELGLEVIGVSFHVGSGCTQGLAFKQAIADARRVFDTANLLGRQMSLLDIGGGFPGTEDCQVEFEEFSEVINGALEEFFPPDSGVQIIAEPGRYYVDSAFTLAAKVIGKRVIPEDMDEHSDVEGSSPDRIMMYYLNDGVYGSLSCLINDPAHSSVDPYLTRVVDSSEQRFRSVLWGPTCDSIDKVKDSCWIPELNVGDWLLINNMGAYSICASTDFNGFERAHIYPVVSTKTWHALNLPDIYNIRQ